ncbi:uncharacterized protein LOC141660494 [Apium graveolens]|uniref:uncharacterized protein LOC141660494 n=1 Tax=Apium graveolens TaxID=4045 RepID=UPI003D79C695
MNIRDTVQSSEVVAGILSVNNINAKVLFDSRATRSFISESFVGKLNCEIEPLVEPLSIIVVIQEQVSVKSICPRCKVEISGYSFPASLIPFQLGEFGIILGMDCLAEYGAQIDCKKKVIRCEGYLAHVMDRSKETPIIEGIPIVNEYPDVFSDELPGLPPDRQIEFSLDLAPDVEPILKAPYRMVMLVVSRTQDEVVVAIFVVESTVVDVASIATSLPSVVVSDETFGSWSH